MMESRGWKQGRKGGKNQVEWNENQTKSNSWKHLFWSNEFSSPVSFPRLSVSLSFSLIKQILVVECVTGESKEIRGGERWNKTPDLFFWKPFLSLSSTLIPPSLNGSYPLFWRAYNSPLAWYVLRNGYVKLPVSICTSPTCNRHLMMRGVTYMSSSSSFPSSSSSCSFSWLFSDSRVRRN